MDQIHDEGLRRLYKYWSDHKAGKKLPNPNCIDLLDFAKEAQWWSLLDVENNEASLFTRYYGTALVDFTGVDMTGKYIPQDVAMLPGQVFQDRIQLVFNTVLKTCAPVVVAPHKSKVSNKSFAMASTITLPFSHDGTTVSSLLHALAILDRRD